MAVTTPPTLTLPGLSPDRSDRATFTARSIARDDYIKNTQVPQLILALANVAANATDAATTAGASATSAGTATTQAGNAAISAGTATTQAGTATTQATASGASATAAAASAVQASQLNLGGKTSAPTLDNQGAALLTGATYYDTTLNKWRVWSSTAWVDGISAIAGVSSVNGFTGAVTIPAIAAIRTPTNVTPAAAATNVNHTATLTGSAYFSLYGLAMTASQWQVSTVSNFASTVISTGDIVGTSTAYTMTGGVLAVSTVYFWRVRYKNPDGVYSDYSTGTSFTTAAVFTSYIATPTATPAAFGDALEGGFYTGMMWNELVQTASSTAISTGSKTFTVADMNAAPIVYSGQTLEVRSRANPVNKMIGVVTAAVGTTLTINITSVGGSGTFTDWSVMAQYRVIVAPKASGENASIVYKNANDAAPAACGTLTEGRKATLAMVAAGSSTVYPAAHFCNDLSIASRTDWYLPARDELELCWRNLKPTADSNSISNDRPTTATPNYMNLGSYGDTATGYGVNNNSSPTSATYTAGAPAQVAAGKNFRTGEAEAFAYGSIIYWSATEFSATNAWLGFWVSGQAGWQAPIGKTSLYYVRAVRRSII